VLWLVSGLAEFGTAVYRFANYKSAVDNWADAVTIQNVRVIANRSAAVHTRAERVGASVGRTSHRTHPEHDLGGRLQVSHLDTHHHELRKRGSSSQFILTQHLTTLNVQGPIFKDS